MQYDVAEWERRFDEAGVWYSRLARFDRRDDLFSTDDSQSSTDNQTDDDRPRRGAMSQVAKQAAATGSFLPCTGTSGAVLIANPIHLSHAGLGSITDMRFAPSAPEIGQHSLEVLREAGVTEKELEELLRSGAFGGNTTRTKAKL